MKLSTYATIAVLTVAPFLSAPLSAKGANGKSVFREQCAGCHGPDGRAQTDIARGIQAADLTALPVQQRSDSELQQAVKSGKGKMPPFQGRLSDDQIEAVVGYLRELGEKH